jgi:uncharacterized membrane protein
VPVRSDVFSVVIWWIYIFILGLAVLPVTMRLFRKFFDCGYLFSKIIGIAAAAYLLWLLSMLRILPFYRVSILILILIVSAAAYIYKKGYKGLAAVIKGKAAIFIAEELLFLAGLLFWAYIRGLQPDIFGLEKYMDFGFVNSILRAKYLPPLDMWFAGESINYYYFGHYICSFLTRLTGIDSAVSYNLMIATIFSFTLSLTFSAISNLAYTVFKGQGLKKAVAAGIISSLLVTFGANLHPFIYGAALPAAKNMGLYHGEVQEYYYPQSTRYIGYNPPTNDKTIHEFPFYSFVVSDLHGHVSDMPFVITFLAILLSYVLKGMRSRTFIIIASLFLAIFFMTNSWDYPIYLTVALFAFIYISMNENYGTGRIISRALLSFVKILALSQLLLLPFTLTFKNFSSGIGLVMSRTPLYQLLILWGYQLFIAACFIIFLARLSKKALERGEGRGFGNKLKASLLVLTPQDVYAFILVCSAAGLVLLPEVVYIRDIYGVTYHRANTMFKLTYQAFIMFGLAAGYITVRIISNIRKPVLRYTAVTAACILLSLPMIYPYYALKGYYGSLKPSNYKGLYGLSFLERSYADDYLAVKWLNENVKGQPVVLEANGDSYSSYNRISMATGLPTVQGWYVHEWLWRGSSDYPEKRAQDVAVVYESDDIEATCKVIYKYNISYIVIGDLEREKFKNIRNEKLISLGKVVFNSSSTKIIKVDK